MVEKLGEFMNQSGMDKYLLGVIIALLSWNVYTTHQLVVDVAVLQERVKEISDG